MRRVWHLMLKELLELRQDPRLFGVIFIAPVLDINLVTATLRQAQAALVMYADPEWAPTGWRQLADADADLADALEKLESSGGGRADLPESQLTGLYQAVTGEGQSGFVPPEQDADFRPGALKEIVHITDAAFHDDAAHPSPPFEQVAAALRDRGVLQIGLAVYGRNGPDGLPHLTDMASSTDTPASVSVRASRWQISSRSISPERGQTKV